MDKQKTCLETLGKEIKTSQDYDFNKSSLVHTEKQSDHPFHIEREFQILIEVRDIQEELLMIAHIVEQQQEVVNIMKHQYRHYGPEEPGDSVGFDGRTLRAPTVFGDTNQRAAMVLQEDGTKKLMPISLSPVDAENVDPITRNRSMTHPQPKLQVPSNQEKGKKVLRAPSGLADLVVRLQARMQMLKTLQIKASNTEKSVSVPRCV
jgi:hypothetical protein